MSNAVPQPWEVYFGGNFWGHGDKAPCDTEIKIGKTFQYAGHTWFFPSVYLCGEGLVADLCMATGNEPFSAFMEKWNLSFDENQCKDHTDEEDEMRLRAEHPLYFPCRLRLSLGGAPLPFDHGCQTIIFSDVWENAPKGDAERSIAAHYALNSALNWTAYRFVFRWTGKRPDRLEALTAAIAPGSVSLPGPHFSVRQRDESISFVHPFTGAQHVLTAEDFQWEKIPLSEQEDTPALYAAVMRCRIDPPLPKDTVEVLDCTHSSGVGICYALPAEDGKKDLFTAFSAPRTARGDAVTWRLVLHGTKWKNEWFSFL